ncbi:uncharacterized protein [Macrobrachium rosenbergii]|uniref:uncharacterized protein n=1 Tax=Macrobrachium rosenbergii TaxID=79674 RepID=UPI0034D76C62
MKWLWITALLFLVTGVKSGPTRKDGDIVPRKITKIERAAMGNATSATADTFMFTISETTNVGIAHLILEVRAEGKPETPVEAIDISEVKTPSFEVDLSNYFGKNANFLITAKDDNCTDIGLAQADLTPFPQFPTVVETTNLDDPRKPSKGAIIRLEGSLGSMLLNNVDPLVTGEQLSYFSFLNTKARDHIPCNNAGGVPVCDVKLDNTKTETKHVSPQFLN